MILEDEDAERVAEGGSQPDKAPLTLRILIVVFIAAVLAIPAYILVLNPDSIREDEDGEGDGDGDSGQDVEIYYEEVRTVEYQDVLYLFFQVCNWTDEGGRDTDLFVEH